MDTTMFIDITGDNEFVTQALTSISQSGYAKIVESKDISNDSTEHNKFYHMNHCFVKLRPIIYHVTYQDLTNHVCYGIYVKITNNNLDA